MERLYDRIGSGYDLTRRADPHIVERLANHLALGNDGTYLDIACGTGNYTVALARQGGRWHGIDASSSMISEGRHKMPSIGWCLARAERLPFADSAFSGAVCTLAIHHFANLAPIFAEVHRVLKGGRFVIFTDTPEQIESYWLNEYFPEAMLKSIVQMPSFDQVQMALLLAGFTSIDTEPYEVRDDLQDLFLYSGKHRPEIYLKEEVRRGISTFSSLADPREVANGCRRLAQDIDSGRIADIVKSYGQESGGDYIFVIARKCG